MKSFKSPYQNLRLKNWVEKKLGYVVALQSGEMISGDSIRETGLYPVYGGGGFRGYTDAFTHRGNHVLIGRQGALCGNVTYAEGPLWATEHAIVATPKENLEPRWLAALLDSMKLGQYSTSAAQPGIAAEVIGGLKIPVPPVPEQRAIAAYLDGETSRLDGLVRAKEGLLELLAEKRRALIARAVTRGLHAKARLRDSGVAWLGLIPAHWPLFRAKYLWQEQSLPTREGDEMVTCFRDGQVTLRKNRREDGFTVGVKELGYQGIRVGQLVLHSMDAFAGAIGVSDSNGKCTPEYIICDAIRDDIYNPYYGHLLRVMALNGFVQATCTAVRERAPRIHFSDFGDMVYPVPPLVEQKAIVAYIAEETGKLDALRGSAERTIRLLKERRAALISAAVTGRIAMREIKA